jgi:mRNA interferase RelE/StbE
MAFEVLWEKRALKELRKLPKDAAQRLVRAAAELRESPMEHSEPLGGCDFRKIRAGDYRAIIEVIFDKKLARVLIAGHRKNIYKWLHRLL